MTGDRIHRTVSDDGTELAGRVHGAGPPLVLVHGQLEDGDTCWGPLLAFLTDRFTCYTPSTRGRGLSGEHSDLSPERLVEDVTAFVDSIGEPVALFGESAGGVLALGAAARSAAVAAVAAYEPPATEALGADEAALFEDASGRIAPLVADGNLMEAGQVFVGLVANDGELASPSLAQHVTDNAHHIPVLLREIRQEAESETASPTDPAVLERITAPVLLLRGSDTALRWHADGVEHVADHVVDSHVRDLAGVGHAGVLLDPEAVADVLIDFFAAQLAQVCGRV